MSSRRSAYDRHQPEARLIEVVAVTFLRGEGEDEHNAMRQVTAYFDKQGNFLAENDPRADLIPQEDA